MNISKWRGLLALLFGVAFCLVIPLNYCYANDYKLASDFKFGVCPITGNQIITQDGRILSNYRIIWFELSNDSRMPVAIDVNAIDIADSSFFEGIMEWVRAGWMYEINKKKWTPQEIQNYKDTFFNLTIKKRIE